MVIIFNGNDMLLIAELQRASDKRMIMLPINKQEAKCKCCLEDLKIIRDKIGTAMPTNAMGPQKAVVRPVKTEEIRMR